MVGVVVDGPRLHFEDRLEVQHIPVGQSHVVDPPGQKENFAAHGVLVHPLEDAENVCAELSDPIDDRGLVQSVVVMGARGGHPFVVLVEPGKGLCACGEQVCQVPGQKHIPSIHLLVSLLVAPGLQLLLRADALQGSRLIPTPKAVDIVEQVSYLGSPVWRMSVDSSVSCLPKGLDHAHPVGPKAL